MYAADGDLHLLINAIRRNHLLQIGDDFACAILRENWFGVSGMRGEWSNKRQCGNQSSMHEKVP
jgi:hypothetical protein